MDTAAAAVGAVGVTATATSHPARTKSLRKLPAGQLLIGTGGNPRQNRLHLLLLRACQTVCVNA